MSNFWTHFANKNCVDVSFIGQNKNNIVMQYLQWRVESGLHEKVEFYFLIAGHTKFACDAMLGLMKRKFKTTMVSSLQDLVKVRFNIFKLTAAYTTFSQN